MSRQPRKVRKALYNAPLHHKQKMVFTHLSKELRAKEKKRSLQLHKGDVVKVMRGKYKGKTGKVARVNISDMLAFVEGVVQRKQSGKEVPAPLQPSNLMITELAKRK